MSIGECIGRGQTADVYAWGNNEAIKLFHDSGGAEHELRAAELVARLDVRAPKVTGMVEYGGRRGIVYERIDGPTMLECLMRQEAPSL